MAPAGPGGRPRNAWTPSRQRKLVRLYMLTLLTKEEIKKVLEAPHFNPSSSDIQKKLRALFPPDYARDHRKFRPSNHINMKLRFDPLRRCKRSRISKEKRLRSRFISRESARGHASWETRTNSVASREHFTHAFRDYTKLSSYDVPTSLSRDLANSEPVYSSLLLLDGSSISTISDSLGGDNTQKTSDLGFPGTSPLNVRDEIAWDIAKPPTGPRARTNEKSREPASSSILNIGKQLGHKYSAAYLKHINSVLRYSSSNSWRSSLGSLSSRASSLMSRTPAHDKSSTVAPVITVEEQKIWKELVDESRLTSPTPSRPPYGSVLTLRRRCCLRDVSGLAVCWECGFTPQHRQAVSSASISLVDAGDPPFKNRGDFYDNTPLHCAAASVGHGDFWKIRSIVRQGVEVDRCNTFGETFLHILCRKGPKTAKDTEDFLLLLTDLSKTGYMRWVLVIEPIKYQDFPDFPDISWFIKKNCAYHIDLFHMAFILNSVYIIKLNVVRRDPVNNQYLLSF